MSETVVIDERFCGPAGSGNGGYSAALAARHVGGPAEVTLRKPPPLGTPLTVRVEGSAASLLDGEALIAEVRSAAVELEVPEPVSAAEAELATLRVQKERAVKLALAMDDDADVVANLRAIKDRIVAVEKHLAAARSTAGLDEITMRRVEAEAVVRLERARDMVQDRAHLRDALSALFPTGLTFHPDGDDWIIAGDAVPCVSAGGGSLPLPRVSRASYD